MAAGSKPSHCLSSSTSAVLYPEVTQHTLLPGGRQDLRGKLLKFTGSGAMRASDVSAPPRPDRNAPEENGARYATCLITCSQCRP
eukprot:3611402-Rhodomonas_salina.1